MESTLLAEHAPTRGDASFVQRKHAESIADSPLRNEFTGDRAFLGLLIFLGTEVMFFAGLISAFLILRAGSAAWPPPDQPRLPLFVTGCNTLILLASAFTIHRAVLAIRANETKSLAAWLVVTATFGVTFLAVQGVEWLQLVEYGLTVRSSVYGGTFYTLIGAHALHVLAAVLVLFFTTFRALRGYYSKLRHNGLVLCRLYWFFVVALWPVLFVLVYLN